MPPAALQFAESWTRGAAASDQATAPRLCFCVAGRDSELGSVQCSSHVSDELLQCTTTQPRASHAYQRAAREWSALCPPPASCSPHRRLQHLRGIFHCACAACQPVLAPPHHTHASPTAPQQPTSKVAVQRMAPISLFRAPRGRFRHFQLQTVLQYLEQRRQISSSQRWPLSPVEPWSHLGAQHTLTSSGPPADIAIVCA